MKYRAVIFDIDGVVADTVNDFEWIDKVYRKNFPEPEDAGFDNWDDYLSAYGDAFRKLSSENGVEVFDGLNLNPQLVIESYQDMEAKKERIMDRFSPFEDAVELLEELDSRDIGLAAVSNASETNTRKFLGDHDLEKYFDFIIGAGIDSFEQFKKEKKPNPIMVEKAMDELEVDPEDTVMIGDSSTDEFAAKNAGVDFIRVKRGENNATEKSEKNVESLNEVLDLIQ